MPRLPRPIPLKARATPMARTPVAVTNARMVVRSTAVKIAAMVLSFRDELHGYRRAGYPKREYSELPDSLYNSADTIASGKQADYDTKAPSEALKNGLGVNAH